MLTLVGYHRKRGLLLATNGRACTY
eukprot:COSAG02_NODE_37270_length_444_cov_0.730435_2_plen_24_part_01